MKNQIINFKSYWGSPLVQFSKFKFFSIPKAKSGSISIKIRQPLFWANPYLPHLKYIPIDLYLLELELFLYTPLRVSSILLGLLPLYLDHQHNHHCLGQWAQQKLWQGAVVCFWLCWYQQNWHQTLQCTMGSRLVL